jgi:hypothetical protein
MIAIGANLRALMRGMDFQEAIREGDRAAEIETAEKTDLKRLARRYVTAGRADLTKEFGSDWLAMLLGQERDPEVSLRLRALMGLPEVGGNEGDWLAALREVLGEESAASFSERQVAKPRRRTLR